MAKTDKTMLDDTALEAFFEAGRAHAPDPGADLLARIVADAEAEIDARSAPAPVPAPHRGVWAALAAALGGWPALASMATAAVTGVWIGFAAPDQVNAVAGGLLPAGSIAGETFNELEDLLPGYGGFEGLAEEVQG